MIERLEVALEAARRLGADEVEVSWAGLTGEFARFASSRFNQVGETREDVVRVRVLCDGRLGAAVVASAEREALEAAARRATEAAERAPRLGVDVGFARAAGADTVARAAAAADTAAGADAVVAAAADTAAGAAADTVAAADTGAAADTVAAAAAPTATAPPPEIDLSELRRAFDRAGGAALFGALKRQRRESAVLTSGGVARAHDESWLDFQVIAQAGDGSGWAGWYGRTGRLDPRAVVERAAATARRARGPVALDPQPLDVVLAPAAVAALLEWVAIASFGGRGALDGTSLLAGRAGELICSPRVTLREEVAAGEAPFDSEGVTRRPVDFVRKGRAGQVVTDLVTAARLGQPGSTGHAAPLTSGSAPADPAPYHLVLDPGPLSEEDLIAMVDRGVYVTRLHYVNGLLDTRRATMTGMTRDGTFLIEGGVATRPVRNLRFTDSVLAALGEERLGGIGRALVAHPASYGGGVISAPALLLRNFQFTGR